MSIFAILIASIVANIIFGGVDALIVSDTHGYIAAGFNEENFENPRSPFFGLFLTAIGVYPDFNYLIPWFNLFLYYSSILILYKSVRAYGISRLCGLVMFFGLSFCNPILLYWNYIHPDILSLSMALLLISVLFVIATKGLNWIYLLLVAFLSTVVLIKPAFALLIIFSPIFLAILLISRARNERSYVGRKMMLVLIASLIPALSYMSYRALVHGSFNIVSFAGVNSFGLSGQLVDEGSLARMNPETRVLARNLKDVMVIASYENKQLAPIFSNSGQIDSFISIGLLYPDIYARNFDVVQNIARQTRLDDETWIDFDQRASKLFLGVVLAEPYRYAAYVIGQVSRAIRLSFSYNLVFLVTTIGLCGLVIARRFNFGHFFCCKEPETKVISSNNQRFVLLALSLGFWLMVMIPSVTVAFAAYRYVNLASIFLPVLFYALVEGDNRIG